MGLPWWLSNTESFCQCRRCRLNPWVESSPGKGNSNLLQYSCQGNPVNRRAWWATVHRVTRVGNDLETKPPPFAYTYIYAYTYAYTYIISSLKWVQYDKRSHKDSLKIYSLRRNFFS